MRRAQNTSGRTMSAIRLHVRPCGMDVGKELEQAMLAVYVSGHGFGHATRTAEVLRTVRERAPELAIAVCTSAPKALFAEAVRRPLAVRAVECDVGLVQRDALTIEETASAEAALRFLSGWPAL